LTSLHPKSLQALSKTHIGTVNDKVATHLFLKRFFPKRCNIGSSSLFSNLLPLLSETIHLPAVMRQWLFCKFATVRMEMTTIFKMVIPFAWHYFRHFEKTYAKKYHITVCSP